MTSYTIRFVPKDKTSEVTLSFKAHSTAGALEVAQRIAEGSWATLYRGNDELCRMQLIEEHGLWRVIRTSPGEES